MKAILIYLTLIISIFSQELTFEKFIYDGEEYSNVSISKVSPIEATMRHTDGSRRIPIINLTEDIQIKLGFDKNEHTQYIKNINNFEKKNRELQEKLKTLYAIKGTITQVTENGVLINDAKLFQFKEIGYFKFNTTDTSTIGFEYLGKYDFFIYGNPPSVVDGDHISYLVNLSTPYSFTTVMGSTRTVRGLTRVPKDFTMWFNNVVVPKNNEIVHERAKKKIADNERAILLEEQRKRQQHSKKADMQNSKPIKRGW